MLKKANHTDFYWQLEVMSKNQPKIWNKQMWKKQRKYKCLYTITYTVVRRCRSTEMVWQVEWSSTLAVDSVASFTTPMQPVEMQEVLQNLIRIQDKVNIWWSQSIWTLKPHVIKFIQNTKPKQKVSHKRSLQIIRIQFISPLYGPWDIRTVCPIRSLSRRPRPRPMPPPPPLCCCPERKTKKDLDQNISSLYIIDQMATRQVSF